MINQKYSRSCEKDQKDPRDQKDPEDVREKPDVCR